MSNCPLCGSTGDDLVFRFYCSNKGCANYVSEGTREQEEAKKSDEKPIWHVIEPVKSPTFSIGSIEKPLPMPPRLKIFDLDLTFDYSQSIYEGLGVPRKYVNMEEKPNKNGDIFHKVHKNKVGEEPNFKTLTNAFEVESKKVNKELEKVKEYFTPKMYAQQVQGQWNCPKQRNCPEFQIVTDPIYGTIDLTWKDKVPKILHQLVEPILMNCLCSQLEICRVREEVVQYLTKLIQNHELYYSEMYSRWELHFT